MAVRVSRGVLDVLLADGSQFKSVTAIQALLCSLGTVQSYTLDTTICKDFYFYRRGRLRSIAPQDVS